MSRILVNDLGNYGALFLWMDEENDLEPYCLKHKRFRCNCDSFQFMKYFTRLFSYSKYLNFMKKRND